MNELLQQLIVAAVVAGAIFYLVCQSRKKGCNKGGGCGCAVKKPLERRAAGDSEEQ